MAHPPNVLAIAAGDFLPMSDSGKISRLLRAAQKAAEFISPDAFRRQPGSTEESIPLWPLFRQKLGDLRDGIGDTSKTLGERRDGLLIGAAGLYLLGYLTWALYGLLNGIGFIPVLDAQYFAAGIVPAILIGLLLLIFKFLRAFQMWLSYAPTPRQITVAQFSILAAALAFLFVLLFGLLEKPFGSVLALVIGVLGLYLADLVARNRGSQITQLTTLLLVRLYTVVGLFFWVWYATDIMPSVPTEWGGARAQCVQCDVDSAQLSPETRSQIAMPSNESTDVASPTVLRTRPLNLIFEGNEYLFLTGESGRPSRANPVYRLRKDAVKAVFACPLPGQRELEQAR